MTTSSVPTASAASPVSAPEMNLRKVTTPVLLHLLGGEMRFPRLFLWRCALTVGTLKARVDRRFPDELVDLAALPIWVYMRLKARIQERRALEIMRVAILTGGVAKWNLQFQTVDRERTFGNLFELELQMNATGLTRWNTLKVLRHDDEKIEMVVTRCLYHELASCLGVPEMTPIICQIDNAAFNSYMPDRVLFHRAGPGHRIADGAKECRFILDVQK